MYVVCGLGNPGKRYANTRHNLGFITVDRLAEKLGYEFDREYTAYEVAGEERTH